MRQRCGTCARCCAPIRASDDSPALSMNGVRPRTPSCFFHILSTDSSPLPPSLLLEYKPAKGRRSRRASFLSFLFLSGPHGLAANPEASSRFHMFFSFLFEGPTAFRRSFGLSRSTANPRSSAARFPGGSLSFSLFGAGAPVPSPVPYSSSQASRHRLLLRRSVRFGGQRHGLR